MKKTPSILVRALDHVMQRTFRTYKAEKRKTLSPWRLRMNEIDENYAFLLQQRDNENAQQKNKRAVTTKRGLSAGILAVRDHGSVQEKLRSSIGGKSMRRLLKREKRMARENPGQLQVIGVDERGTEAMLKRGIDFAFIPPAFGGPSLLLHDAMKQFKVAYEPGFASDLAQ